MVRFFANTLKWAARLSIGAVGIAGLGAFLHPPARKKAQQRLKAHVDEAMAAARVAAAQSREATEAEWRARFEAYMNED